MRAEDAGAIGSGRIDHDTNSFILCNPQNPTGNMWSPEDLMRLGEICLRRRVVVLADEIHCDFAMKGVKYLDRKREKPAPWGYSR